MQPEKPRFKIDENLPGLVARGLRSAGYDAETVLEENLGGAKDPELALRCKDEGRVLITLDLDFADIRAYPPDLYPGFIVFRLKSHGCSHLAEITRLLIEALKDNTPGRTIWIVDERKIRVLGAR